MPSKFLSVRSQQKRRWKTRRICVKLRIKTPERLNLGWPNSIPFCFLLQILHILESVEINKSMGGKKRFSFEVSQSASKLFSTWILFTLKSLMKSGKRWVWYCLQIWLRIFRNLIGETRLYSSSKSQTIVENRNEWIRINLFKSRVKWGNNAWSRLTLITRDSY